MQEMERAGKIDPALIAQYFELGLMGIEVPEQYGGAGGSLMMVTLAVEEISKVDAAAAIMVDVQNTLVNYPINAVRHRRAEGEVPPAAHARHDRRLRAVASRRRAPTRSASRRAPSRRGDTWVLNGRKMWITNGAEAEIFVVFANANPSAGYKGITAFIVERELRRLLRRQEGRQARHPRVEHDGAASSTACEVPDENVLGPVGQGYKIAIETLNEGRIGIGAQMIGVAQGALAAAIAYVKERKQFGKALAEFQGIQFQLAQAAHGARSGAADGLQRGAPQGRRPRHRAARARWRSCSRRRCASA